MVAHMKTTFDLPDALMAEAKRTAAERGSTVKALVEAGLRRELADRARRGRFRLRAASFRGQGMQAGVSESSWENLRELVYEGRGG